MVDRAVSVFSHAKEKVSQSRITAPSRSILDYAIERHPWGLHPTVFFPCPLVKR